MNTPQQLVALEPYRPIPPAKGHRKSPVPELRHEADRLYAPRVRHARARMARLDRLNALGLLELRAQAGEPITMQQAHEATLDALYDEGEIATAA